MDHCRRGRCATMVVVLGLIVILAACDAEDDRTHPFARGREGDDAQFWVGSYVNPGWGPNGRLTLKLNRSESDVTGELVIEPYSSYADPHRFDLQGSTDGETLYLRVVVGGEVVDGFWVTAEDAEVLEGHVNVPVVSGHFTAHQVRRDTLTVVATLPLFTEPYCLVADSTMLVISTPMDWFRLDPASGVAVDTISVEIGPWMRLVSRSGTWDGEMYHGDLSLSDSTEYSQMVAFDGAGNIRERTNLTHRVEGIAYAEEGFWSLEDHAEYLHRVDRGGHVRASYPLMDPDLIGLAYLDGRLICQAKVSRHLVVLTTDGLLDCIYDFPAGSGAGDPRGIAATADGRLYLVLMHQGAASLLQVTVPE